MLALARHVLFLLRLYPRSYFPLTNEVGLAPVSNRVVTGSDEGLLIVEMQHRRYMVSISVSSHVHVICNNE